jgi:acyl-coenzyme A thioesterase PaaI-like protein
VSPERLVHHELCFGCGRTNLFGLLIDVEPLSEGRVRGRGFVKQDHQGPERGAAHEGIVLAALSEAMSLACGPEARPLQIELDVQGPVPVGSFIDVEAEVGSALEDHWEASATASVDGMPVATGRGVYGPRRASEA